METINNEVPAVMAEKEVTSETVKAEAKEVKATKEVKTEKVEVAEVPVATV